MHLMFIANDSSEHELFRSILSECGQWCSLHTFAAPAEALAWADDHPVDIVFIDATLPDDHALEAARIFLQKIQNIRIVLVAQDGRYALDAWQLGLSGYTLKPLTQESVQKELSKCTFCPLPSQRIVIRTIPSFSVSVNGKPLHISAAKPRELLALLVECGEHGLSSSEGIAYLWPERDNDKNTQALFRMTYKRLVAILEEVGAADIVSSRENRRYLRVDQVDCDLYRILNGDPEAQQEYAGQYLQEYSWAEDRNAQLYHKLISKN